MKLFRLLVLLMLCLAIPSYGFANLGVFKPVCPMESLPPAQAQVLTTDLDARSMDADCCVDLHTFLKTGQPCKTGPDCHAWPLAWGKSVPVAAAVPVPARVEPGPDDVHRGRTIGAVWRPPRFH